MRGKICLIVKMTSEDKHQGYEERYEVGLLKDLHVRVGGIEDILEELKEHIHEQRKYSSEWSIDDLCDGNQASGEPV